jgi:MFS family permease
MGLASDYIGDVNSLVISSLFASLSVLFIWVFTGSSIPVMFVFCVLYGFFSGSFTAIVPTVAAHLCGKTSNALPHPLLLSAIGYNVRLITIAFNPNRILNDIIGIKRLASVTGLVYGGIALGALIGSPVGGALLDLSDGKDYLSIQLWTGLVLAASTVMTMILKLMMNPKLFGRV